MLFLTFLDNTIVSVALADVQSSFHIGVSGLQWVVDGYMLAFAALMLTGGTLGDLLGRKRVMLAGLGIFCAGALLAALAPDENVLIAGRVVMGVGAAGSEPGTLSLIRHIFPEPGPRARALGVWTAVSGVALSLGPIVGGVLVGGVGWRGVFWFNLGLGLIAFAVAAETVPESSDREGRQLDLPGLALTVVALTAAAFGVIEGEDVGYTRWWIVLLLAIAVTAAALFLVVEHRSRDPLLRVELLRLPAFVVANLVAFATNFALFAVFFFTALYLQLVAGFSGWQIAMQFLSLAAAMAVAGPLAGRWTARAGPRAPMVAGCVVAGGGMFLVDALLTPHASIAPLAGALALVGVGFGLALVTMTAAVLTLVPAERSGTAASTVNTSRELGGVLGVAVLGAIVDARLTGDLEHRLAAIGIPSGFRGFVINAVTHGGVPNSPSKVTNPAARGHEALVAKVIDAAESAFGSGLHASMLVAAVMLLATGVVAALAVGRGRRA
ncbi:MAG TPA: MFS transporter [Gaiellaceae bacterium]|nr:MFS transporter [Gaiellaceae bacterium]